MLKRIESKIVEKAKNNRERIENKIREFIEMGYEEFSKIANKKTGQIIMYFYCLSKIDLHKEFDRVILEPYRQKSIKTLENQMALKLIKNISDAQKDKRTKEDVHRSATYQNTYKIVQEYSTKDNNVIVLAIPYTKIERTKYTQTTENKRAFQEEITSSEHPSLYEEIMQNRTQFEYKEDPYN